MESFFSRFRNSLALLALLLAQTLALAVQVRRPAELGATDGHNVRLLRYWVLSVVNPVERAYQSVDQGIHNAWFNYLDLRHTRQENYALHQQLAQLRIQQAAIAEDAIQGHRLQGLLAFQQHYVSSTVAAQVIGTSGSEISRVLYLDKGSVDGLKPDQAVITPDGIVGKIRDVFPHTSQLLLINDQTSGAGVLLTSTRIRGILRGTSTGRTIINNLTSDDRIKPGETVLTSGGDQIFPRGLPVGTIEFIHPDPEHQPYTTIRVTPAANLTQLEEVLVITGTQPNLALQTQQDLAAGAEATAEAKAAAAKAEADRLAAENLAKAELEAQQAAHPDGQNDSAGNPYQDQTAAQIVADRLPNLHNGQDKTSGKLTPGAASAVTLPKPLQTIRPDHYSPGAVPPAASMTPGAPPSSDSAVQSPAFTSNSPVAAQQKPRHPTTETPPSDQQN